MSKRNHLPTLKVSAGALAGAISGIVINVLMSYDIKISADTASYITTIVMFFVAYFIPEGK